MASEQRTQNSTINWGQPVETVDGVPVAIAGTATFPDSPNALRLVYTIGAPGLWWVSRYDGLPIGYAHWHEDDGERVRNVAPVANPQPHTLATWPAIAARVKPKIARDGEWSAIARVTPVGIETTDCAYGWDALAADGWLWSADGQEWLACAAEVA